MLYPHSVPHHRKTAAMLVAVLLLLFCLSLPAHAQGTGWYCVRARDHAQPVADPPLREVEKHGGYYIDHAHTDPNAADKVVYLTFDAGYENGNVGKVLDALKAEGATGAFFILGNLPEKQPELVRRMAAEGHLVCNHTFTHKNLCGAPAGELTSELKRLEEACSAIGVDVAPYYRPPEGCFDEAMLREAQGAGYKTVFWSFAYADWDNAKQPDPAAAKRRILDNLHNGEVILLHPTSATNAAILGDVLREIKAQGYRFGTLCELTGGEGLGRHG
jgi:peptidoglycan-N-acetylmuramic acid deacetylase